RTPLRDRRVQADLAGQIHPGLDLLLLRLGVEARLRGPVDVLDQGDPHGAELARRGMGIVRTLISAAIGPGRDGPEGDGEGGGGDRGAGGQAEEGTTIDSTPATRPPAGRQAPLPRRSAAAAVAALPL